MLARRPTLELDHTAADLRERFPELPRPVRAIWSDEPAIFLDRQGPWLYGPAHRDPTAVHGRPVVPRAQLRELERFAVLGVPFRGTATAHELDKAGPVSTVLDLLAGGPRTCTDEVARQVVGPVPSPPALTRLERTATRLTRRAQAVADLLDPIVFGVASPRPLEHGVPALFYPLAVWRW
jgi:hypothetical protein